MMRRMQCARAIVSRLPCFACLVLALAVPRSVAAGEAPEVTKAPLRSPQVPVRGTRLQGLLDQHHESVVVTRDQADVGLFQELANAQADGRILMVLLTPTNGNEVGIYNGHSQNPTLVPIFASVADIGSISVITFQDSPPRVFVDHWSGAGEHLGVTAYAGGDKHGVGIYVAGPGGTFYSQDQRNNGHAAQVLCFEGTAGGISWWIAAEDHPVTDADDDFADILLGIDLDSAVTAVQRTSWGGLKARFR
jgi:hypothetical protein